MAPFDLADISQRLADDVSRLVPDSNGYSVEDYFKLDGPYFVEYVEGCLQVLPMPDLLHQALIYVLRTIFSRWLECDPDGRATMSPFKMYLDERRYREPDVAVMLGRNAHRRSLKSWRGADLAVEIISETNRQHDVVTKKLTTPTLKSPNIGSSIRQLNPLRSSYSSTANISRQV